jgi:hypothetical protein
MSHILTIYLQFLQTSLTAKSEIFHRNDDVKHNHRFKSMEEFMEHVAQCMDTELLLSGCGLRITGLCVVAVQLRMELTR